MWLKWKDLSWCVAVTKRCLNRWIGKNWDPSDFVQGAVSECGAGIFLWSTVLTYNAAKLPQAPKSWADFWDVKTFLDKRALRKSATFTLEFALLADGVKREDLYKVLATPAGVDRAFKKLDQIKPNIQWWESGAQPLQWLVSGDVVMTSAYNGRVTAAQKEGHDFHIVWNDSIYDMDRTRYSHDQFCQRIWQGITKQNNG